MRPACWITKATDTLQVCTTYWFSTATIVTWTRVHDTLDVQWVATGRMGEYRYQSYRMCKGLLQSRINSEYPWK
jgi:hypothetical protein